MMKTMMLLGLLFSSLIVTACSNDPDVIAKVEAARSRNDGPPIWKVTDRVNRDAGVLYLYGAVHILPEGLEWMRPDLDKILNDAGTVFFEAPYDEAARNAADVITARDGYYHSGESLPDRLDGYNKQRLFAATLNANLPDGSLTNMRPWLAADMLALSTLENAGLTGANGADHTLHSLAKSRGKYVRYLETMEVHMSASAVLSDSLQLRDLIYTLDSLDTLDESTERLNAAWLRGDAAFIANNINAPLLEAAPDYYAALFTRRNEAWAETLTPFIRNGGNGLAVIGVGHLTGEYSLVQQLRSKSLTVERFYAYRGENVIKTIDLDMGNPIEE